MYLSTNNLCRALACITTLTQSFTIASPLPQGDESSSLASDSGGFAGGIWLRIMPLGASITFGYRSTDGNGYRKPLRDRLVAYGNDVNMVGSRRNGTMEDNDVEGWPGDVIDQVHAKALTAVPKYKPNVILLNVGTNDCSQNIDLANAGKRMSNLLDDLYAGSSRVTVILSTLLLRWDEGAQECVLDLNEQFRNAAASQRAKGRRIVVADMQPPAGPTSDELIDGTHPTDVGYAKMANVWFNGIKAADSAGFLQPKEAIPGNPDGVPDRGTYS